MGFFIYYEILTQSMLLFVRISHQVALLSSDGWDPFHQATPSPPLPEV